MSIPNFNRPDNLHLAMQYNPNTQLPELRVNMPAVEISNNANNALPVTFLNSQQNDAFGRLRVSSPYTLFDSYHRYQDNGKISSKLVGTATVTHDSSSGTINMNIGTGPGDAIYRESSKVMAYQPGKSLLTYQSFALAPAKPNLTQRIGYFDDKNGVYLERAGNTVSFVIRSSSSGIVQEIRYPQSTWDNPMPYLNLDRVQIYTMDLEWLGVGSLRLGFIIDGKIVIAHTINHANTEISPGVPLNTTYMATACLPVRAEIFNTGTTTSPSTFKLICSSVISEGGYALTGRQRAAGHDLLNPRIITAGTLYPIFSMRLKTNRLGGIVLPESIKTTVSGNVNYRWRIIEGGTTIGGTWIDAGSTDSSVEYNLTATSITGGNISENGFIVNSNTTSSTYSLSDEPFKYQLQRDTFSIKSYELTICIETTGNNNNVWSAVSWQELT